MPRINPLPKAEWSPELTTFISSFRAAVVHKDEPDENRPAGANLLGTFARYPALAKAFLTFNGHLLYGSNLPARYRELLILRIASTRKADYEWAQHRHMALDAGFTHEEIARVTDAPGSTEWKPIERSLLSAADELLADGMISDDTWAVLAGELDDQQLMDVVFVVGTYDMVAMALRSFRIEPDADLIQYLPDHN